MIYNLVDRDNPILSVPLEETTIEDIKKNYDLTPEDLHKNLTQTMAAMGGIGLSANQCGLSIRAFVMYTNLETKDVTLYLNPKITSFSDVTTNFVEGCLTYPYLFIDLKRPDMINFTYTDINGEKQEGKYTGLSSRIFQHEYDHMEGKNFTMYASRLKLDMAKKKAQKKIKLLKKSKESA